MINWSDISESNLFSLKHFSSRTSVYETGRRSSLDSYVKYILLSELWASSKYFKENKY